MGPLQTESDKQHWPTSAKIRHHELQQAVKTTKAPTLVAKMHESLCELHEHDDDAQHYIKPGLGLRLMPITLQIMMLLQCMYQAPDTLHTLHALRGADEMHASGARSARTHCDTC